MDTSALLKKDNSAYLDLLKDLCKKYGADFSIMAAICETESSWNPYATRYEPRFLYVSDEIGYARINGITPATEKHQQMTSWGLGQIMGATARGCGYKDALVRLCDPELGMTYACLYFKKNCDRYPSLDRKIASYNAGSPRYDRGKLTNQNYVDTVLSRLGNYKDDEP